MNEENNFQKNVLTNVEMTTLRLEGGEIDAREPKARTAAE
jgi:hypothetical protein